MARVNATEYAEKWARRTKGSTEDYRKGIENVTVAPGAKAAASADRMLAGITEAITSGKWGKQVSAVSLEDWKNSAAGKGVQRIAAGVDAAAPKQVEMAQKLLAAVDRAVADANKTQRGTLEDNITRATTFMRSMAKNAPKRA